MAKSGENVAENGDVAAIAATARVKASLKNLVVEREVDLFDHFGQRWFISAGKCPKGGDNDEIQQTKCYCRRRPQRSRSQKGQVDSQRRGQQDRGGLVAREWPEPCWWRPKVAQCYG